MNFGSAATCGWFAPQVTTSNRLKSSFVQTPSACRLASEGKLRARWKLGRLLAKAERAQTTAFFTVDELAPSIREPGRPGRELQLLRIVAHNVHVLDA
jgi:hypothetical protein